MIIIILVFNNFKQVGIILNTITNLLTKYQQLKLYYKKVIRYNCDEVDFELEECTSSTIKWLATHETSSGTESQESPLTSALI